MMKIVMKLIITKNPNNMKAKDNSRQDPYEFFKIYLKGSEFGDSLYAQAESMCKYRTFNSIGDTMDWLDQIKDEIMIRIKITNTEIFTIGELLHKAKRICRANKVSFKVWVEENFGFSYETSKNFTNVYENCLAYRKISENVPPSIMYKIAAPSFSEELKDYLFVNGNLDKMSNFRFSKIIKKYNEGGLEALAEDIQAINRGIVFYYQVNFILDLCKHEEQRLIDLMDKIKSILGIDPVYENSETMEPEANEIVRIMYAMLDQVYDHIADARTKSGDIAKNLTNQLRERVA